MVYFVVAVNVIIPAFNPKGPGSKASPFVQLYAYLVVDQADHRTSAGFDNEGYNSALGRVTPGAVARKVLFDPVGCVRKASQDERKRLGAYNSHLLAPTGGLAILAPPTLLVALPSYLQNVLAQKYETSTIFYQYNAGVTPFVFISVILAIAWLRRFAVIRKGTPILALYLLIAAVTSSWLWGKQLHPVHDPFGMETAMAGGFTSPFHSYSNDVRRDDVAWAKDAMISRLEHYERDRHGGRKVSVIASFDFLQRIALRDSLHSWHYVRTGRDPVTNEEIVSPQTEYALLDFGDDVTFRGFTHERSGLLQSIYFRAGGWEVVHQVDTAVLLARGGAGRAVSSLVDVVGVAGSERLRRLVVPAGAQDTGLRLLDARLTLGRAELGQDDDRRVIEVMCAYAIDARTIRRTAVPLSRQLAVFEVTGADGRCYRRGWPIAYTLVDPDRWPAYNPSGPAKSVRAVRVNYPLLLPRGLPPGDYRVALSIRDHVAGPSLCHADLGTVRVPPAAVRR
jgi:hypothetical protein